MGADGSFPLETARTKPYGYSLFNLDAMVTAAWLLSTPSEDLWRFNLPDGRGLRRAVAFMVPFIRERQKWPFPPDVMYADQWPMRQASLLFAGLAYGETSYLELWKTLPADSSVDEVVRNFFVRQPVLWVPAIIPRSTVRRRCRSEGASSRAHFPPTPSSFSRSEAPSIRSRFQRRYRTSALTLRATAGL